MTTIGDKGFENDPGWVAVKNGTSWFHNPSFTSWKTEGSQSWLVGFSLTGLDFDAGEYIYATQTVNFDSDFTLYWDYNVTNLHSSTATRLYIGSDLLFNSTNSSGGVVTNANVAVSGYRGNHVLKIGIYALANSSGIASIAMDNMRIVSESAHKYVDISTGSDSDTGETWPLAYQTVKKGIDNIPDASWATLHIAEGDYSAQAAIDLDKNLSLLCEDYGGGNASPPLTVVLPATV